MFRNSEGFRGAAGLGAWRGNRRGTISLQLAEKGFLSLARQLHDEMATDQLIVKRGARNRSRYVS